MRNAEWSRQRLAAEALFGFPLTTYSQTELAARILRGDRAAWAEVARSAEGPKPKAEAKCGIVTDVLGMAGKGLPDIAAGALSRGALFHSLAMYHAWLVIIVLHTGQGFQYRTAWPRRLQRLKLLSLASLTNVTSARRCTSSLLWLSVNFLL